MELIDWLSDKVQTFTGEKERRQLVSEIKEKYDDFKNTVESLVKKLNDTITNFNISVKRLNIERQGIVAENINSLSMFLVKFGRVKDVGQYCDESEKELARIPEHEFESVEKYILSVDWSKDEVFNDSFFLSPIGMKIKTRKQNVSMGYYIDQFQIAAEETENQLKMRTFSVGIEKEICDLFIDNISFISNFIKTKILPELYIVEAFFEAMEIKDKIISNQIVEGVTNKNEILLVKDTKYEKHYYFIKNSFIFYVFSCKVFNSPILTRLLNNQSTQNDITKLKKHKEELEQLSTGVEDNIFIK